MVWLDGGQGEVWGVCLPPPSTTPNCPTWTPPPQPTLPTPPPPHRPSLHPLLQCPPPAGGHWPTSTGGGGGRGRVQKRGDVPPMDSSYDGRPVTAVRKACLKCEI